MSTPAARPLPRTTPRDAGVDARGLTRFLDALEAHPGTEPHGLVVVVGGAVVAEGWWAPYRADGRHLLYSLSKSFTSTALGFAVGEGLVDLDATVLSSFPELDGDVVDERSRSLRVRHVAAMASGHTEDVVGLAARDETGDALRGFLRVPPPREPGSVFCYNQPCTFAVSATVQRAAGTSLTDYLRPRLFEPLGITGTGWTVDGRGREIGWSGLHASTEDVAKLGLLLLRDGVWEGTRLLPEGWVAEATREHVATRTTAGGGPDWQQGYAFQFWRSRHGYRGDGAFGQFCLVLPEADAVVALTSQSPDLQAVLDAAWQHLLPALTSGPGDGAGATAADDALAARLAAGELPLPGGGPADLTPVRADVAPGCAPPSPSAVEVRRAGEGVELVLHGAGPGGPLVVPLAAHGWSTAWPLAAAAAADGDALLLDVVFLETPHRLHLRVERGGRGGAPTATARWATPPLHAPALDDLRAPR